MPELDEELPAETRRRLPKLDIIGAGLPPHPGPMQKRAPLNPNAPEFIPRRQSEHVRGEEAGNVTDSSEDELGIDDGRFGTTLPPKMNWGPPDDE